VIQVKNFSQLTEREVLAVAISSEQEDSRIYMTFAEDLKDRYPDTATVFERMAGEERDHRHRLLEMYEARFGQHLPPRTSEVSCVAVRSGWSRTSRSTPSARRWKAWSSRPPSGHCWCSSPRMSWRLSSTCSTIAIA